MVPQHIGNGDLADDGTKETGPLEHAGSDEQSAIASASYGELFRICIFIFDEPFGGGDEVVKDVLLFVEHPCLVPFFAVLSTSSQVCDGIYAAQLEPGQGIDGKIWFEADVISAVAVKQSGVAGVEL